MAAYILVIIGLVTIIYYLVTRNIISRLRAEEAPKSASGLVRADQFSADEDVRAHGIDVIFVHGLGSNPDTTWGPKDSNIVSDFFLQDITPEAHQYVRVFFYNYDSYWKRDAVQSRLSLFGGALLDHICTTIRKKEKERTRSLVFVAYSYGGLVVKQALVLAKGDPKKYAHVTDLTKSIYFLGTPHRGSSLSVLGGAAAWALLPLGSNPGLLAEIADDSSSLRDLHTAFRNSVSDKLQVCNFFEQRKTRIISLGVFQWEEFCVRESSATYDESHNIPLPVDHFGLNKFKKEGDDYNMVIGRLANLITSLLFSKPRQFLSVPPSRIEAYTERHVLSAAVAEKLHVTHKDARVPHALAIHGLGGCGKTQLALKYIEDHKDRYRTILWIDAQNEATTRSSFERCAYDLQLGAESSQTQSTKLDDHPAVRAVFHWLERQDEIEEKWLVIFDNADDVTWWLKTVIPRGTHGSVLITSQDTKSQQLVGESCEEVRVNTLEPEEASALLLRHLQLDTSRLTKEILQDCEEIAERLGYLAIAVGLAGAYIANSDEEKPHALRQYLKDFSAHQDDLLKHQHYQGLSDHDKTVWTVWDTTLTRIEKDSPDLRPGLLLAFLARFDGAVVQEEALRLASVEMKRVHEVLYPSPSAAPLPRWLTKALALADTGKERAWDDFHYRQSRDILVRYNLLQRIRGSWPGVSMHSLVRWRAQRYEHAWASEVWHLVAVMSACIVTIREESNPRFRRELVVHIPAVGPKRLKRLGVCDEGKEFVWATFGTVMHQEGWWKEAEKLKIRALALNMNILGEEHPATLTAMADLAATYNQQARWAEAEALQAQALVTRLKVLGSEHPDTLDNMSSLAATYWNQRRLAEAEELELQELETRKRVFGEEDPDTLHCMSLLAMTYIKQELFDKAEPLQVKYLEICEGMYSHDHPTTLRSKSHLASTYTKQGRWAEAEEMQVQVMEAMTNLYGENHHLTLDSISELAQTYWYQERWENAESLDAQALKGRMRLLGANHPKTLESIGCLASTYRNQGKLKEAEDLEAGEIDLDRL